MIDFHNHILPDLDDGASNMDETLKMLKTASDQGITDIICTVHYQHPKLNGKTINYDIVIDKINEVNKAMDGINLKLHPGSEVFFLPNLVEIKSDPITVFGNGKYMLIEFQVFQFPKDFELSLYDLILSGTTPIIAHPERYRPIQNNIFIIEKLINLGCLIQIDAGSLIGHFGKKCKLISKMMLERNMVHFIGSDSHNSKKRNFCLKEAMDLCEKIKGHSLRELVYDNPKKVIIGEKIIPDDIIDSKYTLREKIMTKFY